LIIVIGSDSETLKLWIEFGGTVTLGKPAL